MGATEGFQRAIGKPFGRLRRGETPALTRESSMKEKINSIAKGFKGQRSLQPPRIRADCAEQIDTEPHHHQRNVEDRRTPALRLQGENRHIHPRQHIQQVAVSELEAAQRLVSDDNHQVRPDHQRQPNQPERIPAAAANQRIEIHA